MLFSTSGHIVFWWVSVLSSLWCCILRVAGCNENGNGADPRQRLEEQQWYIQCIRETIRLEQKRAERDLDREQARLQQQHTDSEY